MQIFQPKLKDHQLSGYTIFTISLNTHSTFYSNFAPFKKRSVQNHKNHFVKQSTTIKLLFFLTYASAASWLSFFNMFLKNNVGLSDGQIGIVIALQQFSMLVVLPLWGIIADRFGRKNVLSLVMFLAIIALYGFLIQNTFISILAFMLLFTVIYNPITPLLDSIALDYIESKPGQSYGIYRLWASVGWASSSAITGTFIDETNAQYIFIIASTILAANFIILKFIYKPIATYRTLQTLRISSIADIFLSDKRLYIMLIIMMCYGVFSAPMHQFINIYYLSIGASYKHVGYAYLFQALAEVPFFIYGKKIIERFGARKLIVFTMLVSSARLISYGMISNPWTAILIGTSHGISLGLFLLSFVAFVHQFIAPEYRATGQSFVYAFYFGGGLALGNMTTGAISDQVGMQQTMLIQGTLIFLLVIVTVIIFGVLNKRKHLQRKASKTKD